MLFAERWPMLHFLIGQGQASFSVFTQEDPISQALVFPEAWLTYMVRVVLLRQQDDQRMKIERKKEQEREKRKEKLGRRAHRDAGEGSRAIFSILCWAKRLCCCICSLGCLGIFSFPTTGTRISSFIPHSPPSLLHSIPTISRLTRFLRFWNDIHFRAVGNISFYLKIQIFLSESNFWIYFFGLEFYSKFYLFLLIC